ncbi:DUF1254 domain-containing protein [Pseudomonas cavernae]|uniref:DUF1254 domain-containing protein n=1 Tax=Pseudomonas cavernae TaxID=2320867 RepID=A0A385Z4R2_9PSED|nr:DUF1254 domain-containing protein [Pseudomonas cavernae]AYC33067.1 DUF1254 domain-containing protein [Pseudomonas cavernae]
MRDIPFSRRHTLSRRQLLGGLTALGAGLACPSWLLAAAQPLSDDPTEFQAIARDAWIYAYPMLMHYQTMQKQALNPKANEYVGGFGQFRHYSELFTPQNRDIVTPNNDTPYSWAWLDLRAEPWVLSVPAVDAKRYYVHQLVDQYTQNFAYVGVLSTGREAGDYLIAGPEWQGETPAGIKQVLRSEAEIVMILGRTGLNSHDDLPAVRAIQQQYQLRALHDYAGTAAPAAAAAIAWLPWEIKTGLGAGFIPHLNQLLTLCPVVESERGLRERFARIGIVPGQPFDAAALSAVQRQALIAGIQQAQAELKAATEKTPRPLSLFGDRKTLANDYLKRASGAALGIYGNSIEEAFYTGTKLDGSGQPLVAGQKYRLRFAPDQLPPASQFWSLTLYDLPDRQLVVNPLDRYCLSSRDALQRDADGGLTLLLQTEAPAEQSNWLPAPAKGPFFLALRLYGPSAAVKAGQWQMPKVERL